MNGVAKTKVLISCAVTAQLICAFGFAYANFWFSDLFELSAPLFSHRQKSGFKSVFISFRVHLSIYWSLSCEHGGITQMFSLSKHLICVLVIKLLDLHSVYQMIKFAFCFSNCYICILFYQSIKFATR